jgi:hypothetical protein
MKRFSLAVLVVSALGLCSVALAASTLSGMYKTKIHSTALGGALNGTWTIDFKSGGYTVTDNGAVAVVGRYEITGSKISLKDTGGKDSCLGAGTTGHYTFKLNANKLTFTKISETRKSCGQGRALVLTNGTFTKVG